MEAGFLEIGKRLDTSMSLKKEVCQIDLIFSGNRADRIPGFQQDAWEGDWENTAGWPNNCAYPWPMDGAE